MRKSGTNKKLSAIWNRFELCADKFTLVTFVMACFHKESNGNC